MTLATRPKPPAHHKKRYGHHQHRQKHFAKAYWPYLPLLGVVAFGLIFSSIWSHKAAVLGAQSDLSQVSLLTSTNSARLSYNESILALNRQLSAAAQAKADDMAAKGYWSHNAPSGQTPWDFITAAGYNYSTAGENLAYGFSSADQTTTAWLNSPEHRANLLGTDYSQVGFGVASSPNYQGQGPEKIVVAMYASPEASSVGVGATVAAQPHVKGAVAPVKSVSRIQLVSDHASWTTFSLVALASVGLIVIVLQHARAWRRVLVKSEAFVIHHPLYDFAAALVVVAAFVLTRTSGFIG